MADLAEVALSTVADGLDQPDWADMMNQAEELTAKGKLPAPVDLNAPSSKHTLPARGSGKAPRGRGRGRGGASAGTRGGWQEKHTGAASSPRPYLTQPSMSGMSEKIQEELKKVDPLLPGKPSEVEDDIDKLSTAASEHEEKIGALEENLSVAQKRIAELEEDQKLMMSDFSSLRHELNLVKARLSAEIQTPNNSSSQRTAHTVSTRGKETLGAPPSTGSSSVSAPVDKVPAWKKKRV